MRKVGAGVIGLGMGKVHAAHYQECPEADLIALCDMDEGRLASVAEHTHPRRTYREIDAFLADPELEAVSIALPNALHAEIAIRCLEAGKHVLCEKPLAINAIEGRKMVEVARQTGMTLMVGFNNRFRRKALAVKAAIDCGALGRIYFARAVWHRTRGIPGLGTWFTRKSLSGGGALIDLGVHRLDLALWYMGYPRPVAVSGAVYDHLGKRAAAAQGMPFEVEDLGVGFIRFEDGATLVLEASWATNSQKREDQSVQLYGIDGGAVFRNWDEGYEFEARLFRGNDEAVWIEEPQYHGAIETPQQHFCRAILDGRETMAPGEQGLTLMRILDALYESARTGREVRLETDSTA